MHSLQKMGYTHIYPEHKNMPRLDVLRKIKIFIKKADLRGSLGMRKEKKSNLSRLLNKTNQNLSPNKCLTFPLLP